MGFIHVGQKTDLNISITLSALQHVVKDNQSHSLIWNHYREGGQRQGFSWDE